MSAAQPPSLSSSPPSVLGPDLSSLAGPGTSQSRRALLPLKSGAARGTCRSAKRAPLASMPFSSLLTCSGLALCSRAYFLYLVTPGGGVPCGPCTLLRCPGSSSCPFSHLPLVGGQEGRPPVLSLFLVSLQILRLIFTKCTRP